jgi:hypothetical protein
MSAAMSLWFKTDGIAVARPVDFAPAEQLLLRLRTRFGTEIVPKKKAMKKLLMGTRENKAMGILLDQNVDWYEGVFVPFMGKPACTNKGLALIAMKTGAPVIPVFSARQPDGRYRVVFEKEVDLVPPEAKFPIRKRIRRCSTGSSINTSTGIPSSGSGFTNVGKPGPVARFPVSEKNVLEMLTVSRKGAKPQRFKSDLFRAMPANLCKDVS